MWAPRAANANLAGQVQPLPPSSLTVAVREPPVHLRKREEALVVQAHLLAHRQRAELGGQLLEALGVGQGGALLLLLRGGCCRGGGGVLVHGRLGLLVDARLLGLCWGGVVFRGGRGLGVSSASAAAGSRPCLSRRATHLVLRRRSREARRRRRTTRTWRHVCRGCARPTRGRKKSTTRSKTGLALSLERSDASACRRRRRGRWMRAREWPHDWAPLRRGGIAARATRGYDACCDRRFQTWSLSSPRGCV